MQEIAVEFVYSRRQKMKDFLSQRNNRKLWVEMIIVAALDAIATVTVLTASNNDVKPVETRTVPHFA